MKDKDHCFLDLYKKVFKIILRRRFYPLYIDSFIFINDIPNLNDLKYIKR